MGSSLFVKVLETNHDSVHWVNEFSSVTNECNIFVPNSDELDLEVGRVERLLLLESMPSREQFF